MWKINFVLETIPLWGNYQVSTLIVGNNFYLIPNTLVSIYKQQKKIDVQVNFYQQDGETCIKTFLNVI